eukprot:GFYU01006979.1.p1 GENE.GFYU01006979.1~~GFYU01006979.1.p1  ORF type:complete len:708 (-),score=206.83 GFYU01006979.1:453-2576(-)
MDPVAARRLANLVGQFTTSASLVASETSATATMSPTESLEKERSMTSFDVRTLTYLLDGGKSFTAYKELAAQAIQSDDVMMDLHKYDMTRPEERAKTMQKIFQTIDVRRGAGDMEPTERKASSNDPKRDSGPGSKMADAFYKVMSLYDSNWGIRIGVHYGLFGGAVLGQGSDEQVAEYSRKIEEMRVVGCFAMTELGHGSYIRGLETTATFDKATQQFVLNSPTITSTKWWIGMAAQTATHSVVFARLVIDGKDYGVNQFIVQLRELETGRVLPGIEIGDCGSKMGRNGIDNGWIRFQQVRIPRTQMLMRWSKVSPEGVFTPPPKAQLTYGALLTGRVGIVEDSAATAAKALTIATRYTAIRRQFHFGGRAEETKILDYQTTAQRVVPTLCQTYAMTLTAQQLRKKFDAMEAALSNNDFETLPEVHATSAGLKAFVTWWTNSAIEELRQCCGGHGYSSYNAFATMLSDFAIMCSWEGDNTVLALQTARFLISSFGKVKENQIPNNYVAYLALGNGPCPRLDASDPVSVLKCLQFICAKLVERCSQRLNSQANVHPDDAWNNCSVDLVECAKLHTYSFMLHCFIEAIDTLDDKYRGKGLEGVMKDMCNLFALNTLQPYMAYWQAFSSNADIGAIAAIQDRARHLMSRVRQQAVGLVDAFNLPDFVVSAPIGRHDGNIYEAYFETVKNAPKATGIPDYFEESIKPLLVE